MCSFRLPSVADLDEHLSLGEKFQGGRQRGRQDLPHPRVRGVAAGHPKNLGRSAVTLEKVNEVLILGEHDRVRFASRKEDLGVDRAVETQLLDVQDHEIELLREPSRQGGRELCINPDRRAASTG